MAYKMKGFSGFGNSPAKQKIEKTKELKETWPPEGTVPREELTSWPKEKGVKKIKKAFEKKKSKERLKDFDNKSKDPNYKWGGKKKSPAKQEGPIDKKQMGLQKGEMEGTSVYSGKDKSERMIDLEDRIEFLSSDIEGGSDRPGQNMSDMKKARKRLQHELDIMMNRKGSGVKKSPGKMYGKKKK